MRNTISIGDCLLEMQRLSDNSIDAIVTDPPYGLAFMGKKWDYDVPSQEIWKECLRVLKPGGYLLAFAGTRTQHRMACRIEDAGFEIRDMIAWVYGTGFPKSLDVGKAVDKLLGNEREVVGENPYNKLRGSGTSELGKLLNPMQGKSNITKGTSEWEGWGTALKPALEPITVARKPLSESTVAKNVLKWGVGGLDIDGSRIENLEYVEKIVTRKANPDLVYGLGKDSHEYTKPETSPLGRFPANLIHDGSEEVVSLFPNTKSGVGTIGTGSGTEDQEIFGKGKGGTITSSFGDSGSAARFFFMAEFDSEDYFNYLCAANKYIESWQDQSQAQSNVGTVQLSSYLQSVVEDSVQRLVVIKDSQEDSLLKNTITPFMKEIQKVLKSGCGSDIEPILNSGQKCLQELKHMSMELFQSSPVRYVEIRKLTNTMMIIQNLLNIDGFVEAVISNTMLCNTVLGERASRFNYCAKASKSERNEGLNNLDHKAIGLNTGNNHNVAPLGRETEYKNHHPTVKPVALMEYLIGLVSKKGALILDPFGGSGTTAIACINTERDYVLIERDPEYFKIINARVAFMKPKVVSQLSLF